MSTHRSRMLAALLAAALLLAVAPVAGAQDLPGPGGQVPAGRGAPAVDLDVRQLPHAVASPTLAQRAAAAALGAHVRWDGITAVPQTVLVHGGALTPPVAGADPIALATDFVAAHAALWRLDAADLAGLQITAVVPSPGRAATHVWLQQTVGDRAVFGGVLGITVDADGRVMWAGGPLWPEAVDPGSGALGEVGAVVAARAAAGAPAGTEVDEPTPVVFPLPGGVSRPAWWTVVHVDHDEVYETVVDADTGVVLYRVNQVRHAGAEGNVFRTQHPEVPGAAQQITSFAGASFNDAGWVADRTTAGNNAIAFHDTDGDGASDYTPQTPASGDPGHQHFTYTFTNAIATSMGTDWTTDRDAVITQAFYYTNLVHDRLYPLGFDEASGNFQADNFGRGGSGGDRVAVRVDTGAASGQCCNASFNTPRGDGRAPTMTLLIETPGDGIFGHGALDGDTVVHEYGHGVHNRLVNGGMGNGSGAQVGGLGEGWGDALAFSVWDDPILFEYVTSNKTTGLRRVAYDTSGWSYDDLCNAGCQVHRDGEVWATALWDVRAHLIARRGQADGVTRFEQLVVDGMKNTAGTPTFLDARDGILTSSATLHGDGDMCGIWNAFASNGMGTSALSPTQVSITEGADVPAACEPTAVIAAPATVAEGQTAALDASGSSAGSHPSTGSSTYAWDLDGDGEYDDSAIAAPTVGPFTDDGPRTFGLRVTNEAGRADETSVTVAVSNVAPSGAFTGATDTIVDEGDVAVLEVSFTDPGWGDTYTATVDWGDGAGPVPITPAVTDGGPGTPDSGLLVAEHVYGDDGDVMVTVDIRDDDGGQLLLTRTAEVANVDPATSLAPGQVTAILEGGTLAVHATFTDPGFEDTYTATVDWGTGEPAEGVPVVVDVEGGPGTTDAGSLTASHDYGDRGTFPVTITVRDDDGGMGVATFDVDVANVAPTAVIDPTGSVTAGPEPTFVVHAGAPLDVTGTSTDPGSDDLTATWAWGDGTTTATTHLVNPPGADPFPSPAVAPRAITDAQSHTYGDACLYTLALGVEDDDAGGAAAAATVVVQGNAADSRGAGWWYQQYRGGSGGNLLPAAERACFLAITAHLSSIFDEVTPADTAESAAAVLDSAAPTELEQLDRQLLTGWLNFAGGAFDLDTLVDRDGDGTPETTFGHVLASAEAARVDPGATTEELRDHAGALGRINGGG